MTKADAMNKLVKLIALSKSDNVNEAALAIARANELREKYDIKDSDYIIEQKYSSPATQIPVWQKMFMGAVSDLYGTQAVVSKRYNQADRKYEAYYSFTGEELDVFFCKEMYDYLCDTMTRAKKAAWYSKDLSKRVRGKQAVNNFGLAFAHEICQRIGAMGDNASWAPLKPKKIEAAKKWLKESMGRELQCSTMRASYKGSEGVRQGRAAGSDVNLGKQMNGSEGQLRLTC